MILNIFYVQTNANTPNTPPGKREKFKPKSIPQGAGFPPRHRPEDRHRQARVVEDQRKIDLGKLRDVHHAVLCGTGYNLRKLLRGHAPSRPEGHILARLCC